MEEAQNHFEGWAIVEIFGHQKAIGFVRTEYYGAACMFRVDTPELPEREVMLQRPETAQCPGPNNTFVETWVPAGSKVTRQAVAASSQLLGVGSIYRLVPCTEAVARKGIEELMRPPLILLELPQKQLQLSGSLPGEEPVEEDQEQEEEDEEFV